MTPERHLYVLRHAKSSWEDRSLRDHARPLAPRGVMAAQAVGRHLAAAPTVLDLVLCSTAVRTRETWAGVRDGVAVVGEPEVRFVDEIYDAPVDTLLGLLRDIDPDVRSVLLVGHNPGCAGLAALLAGDGESAAMRRLAEKYPTGALAVLRVDVEWASLAPASAWLEDFVRPRDLPG